MTDNAFAYTRSSELRALLGERQIKHILIRPRRPQTNGKVERFQQLDRGPTADQSRSRPVGAGHLAPAR